MENGEASHPTILANACHEVIFEKMLNNGPRKRGLIHKSLMQMLNANSRYAKSPHISMGVYLSTSKPRKKSV